MSTTLPGGWTIRSPLMTDLQSMYEVAQAYQRAAYGEVDLTLEDLRTLCQAPTFDLAQQAHLVFDPSGRLIYVVYFDQQAGVRYTIALDALPGHEDGRVRTFLMDLGEAWARRTMAQAPQQARTFLSTWIAARDVAARAWFRERRDFAEVRHFWEMQIEMDEAPVAPLWPRGVSLRPFDPARDSQVVFEAENAFFRDHWGYLPQEYGRWRHWSVERADFDPTLWFVVYAGERVVGISLCKDGEKGWVDTLGVARAWRGQGLGLALLHHSFGAFYGRGRRRVGLGVDSQSLTGAPRLYERAGMHMTQESITYEKELRTGVELSVRALEVQSNTGEPGASPAAAARSSAFRPWSEEKE